MASHDARKALARVERTLREEPPDRTAAIAVLERALEDLKIAKTNLSRVVRKAEKKEADDHK